LGFFVLRAMDNTDADVGTVDVGDADASTTPGSDTTPPASDAAPAARPPGQVTIVVANASGVQGAAAKQTEKLAQSGYLTAPAGNAPEGTELQATQIMAAPGYEPEAAALAAGLGKPDAVVPLPNPAPVDMTGANILVLLGTDLAAAG
ncbi:MAG TPA: LytR C-terminal domain-containing protein, partial [Acidimicrobiales bacterium]|nr:LytR C-terminal domain-containing protein [Acidimicrobiales bacterium]